MEGALTNRVQDAEAMLLESTTAVRGYDDSGDVLIALTITIECSVIPQAVIDQRRLG